MECECLASQVRGHTYINGTLMLNTKNPQVDGVSIGEEGQ